MVHFQKEESERRRYLLNTIPKTRLTGQRAAAFSLLRRCGRRRRKTDCGRQRSVFWSYFSSGGLIPPHFFRPPLLPDTFFRFAAPISRTIVSSTSFSSIEINLAAVTTNEYFMMERIKVHTHNFARKSAPVQSTKVWNPHLSPLYSLRRKVREETGRLALAEDYDNPSKTCKSILPKDDASLQVARLKLLHILPTFGSNLQLKQILGTKDSPWKWQ